MSGERGEKYGVVVVSIHVLDYPASGGIVLGFCFWGLCHGSQFELFPRNDAKRI
jgi:hypothetical protein